MRGKIILSAVVAAAGLGAFTAATASADDTDDTFVNALQNKGIPFSSSQNVIALAQSVCESVAAGLPADQVAEDISGAANWSVDQGRSFVSAATEPGDLADIGPQPHDIPMNLVVTE